MVATATVFGTAVAAKGFHAFDQPTALPSWQTGFQLDTTWLDKRCARFTQLLLSSRQVAVTTSLLLRCMRP